MKNVTLIDRVNIQNWIKKLSAVRNSKEEKLLRNDFMAFLVRAIQDKELIPPFNEPPPPGPLTGMMNLLVDVLNMHPHCRKCFDDKFSKTVKFFRAKFHCL